MGNGSQKIKWNLLLVLGYLFLWVSTAYAILPLPNNLNNFYSHSGMALFKKNLNENSLKLLANFTTQQTPTYCGIASAVMVLNSIPIKPPADLQHAPYRYFTQDNFFNDAVKKMVTPDAVQKRGVSLMELSEMLNMYGLKTKPIYANTINIETFRELLKTALSKQQFIIVNFLRTGLQEIGGGHHSPIAAYDPQTDRFLVLDVARYKYPPYWVKTEDLWKGVNTKDKKSYRGFILIQSIYLEDLPTKSYRFDR